MPNCRHTCAEKPVLNNFCVFHRNELSLYVLGIVYVGFSLYPNKCVLVFLSHEFSPESDLSYLCGFSLNITGNFQPHVQLVLGSNFSRRKVAGS